MGQPSNAAIVDALQRSRGLVSIAARTLGCSRETVHRRIRRVPAVRRALDDARSLTLDVAEAKLFGAVDAGEHWAIAFLLRTIGASGDIAKRPRSAWSTGWRS